MLKKILYVPMAVVLLFALASCSSTPKIEEYPPTASAPDELQKFTADMQKARGFQVAVLAPNAFANAEDALERATEDHRKGRDRMDVLHWVAVGRAYLNQATQTSDVARNSMEDVVSARQAALNARANTFFPKEFKDIDHELQDVTERIEGNDVSTVSKHRTDLQKMYLDIELKAIKHANLGAAEAAIAQAIDEGAEDYAKQTLARAKKKVADTNAFINANRHQTDAVKTRSQDATKEANHVLKITRLAKSGQNISAEEIALKLEAEQQRAQQERDQLNAEKMRTANLTTQARTLKSEQAFNETFEHARKEFTAEEAEVYRQGNQLVIRLRSIEFPVNKATLNKKNFPVLAKVTKVVQEFEAPSVVVEGHTDTDGSKERNATLSTERAEAVSDYLVSNGAIDGESISAVGYSSDRPIAPNNTAKGKAQNRRVDIVINAATVAE